MLDTLRNFWETTGLALGFQDGTVALKYLGMYCIIGILFYLFRDPLLNIYAPGQPEVIAAGIRRLIVFSFTYFICGIMDVMVGGLRGLGYSITPMIVSLLGACAFRIFWVKVIFPLDPTLNNLYLSYPISWILTALAHIICYVILTRSLPRDGELPPVKTKKA